MGLRIEELVKGHELLFRQNDRKLHFENEDELHESHEPNASPPNLMQIVYGYNFPANTMLCIF